MKRYSPTVSWSTYYYGDGGIYNDEKVSSSPYGDMIQMNDGKYVKLEDVEKMLESIACLPYTMSDKALGIMKMKLMQIRNEL